MGLTPVHFWRCQGIWGQRTAVLYGESPHRTGDQELMADCTVEGLSETATHPCGGHHADVTTVDRRICAAEVGDAAAVCLNLQPLPDTIGGSKRIFVSRASARHDEHL